jgi:hypothetical protein
MATFTVDLLTGEIYLFTGDFNGSGSTPTTGATYPQVEYYDDLPLPASDYAGLIYVVLKSSGFWLVNRHDAGLYYSNGAAWVRLGDIPSYFNNLNFQIYDGIDNTKGIKFVTSGLTSGIFRNLKIQDSSGTIAYLTDLNTKVDQSLFNTFTGTTLPANYYNKIEINNYTGVTDIRIQDIEDYVLLLDEEVTGLTAAFNSHTGQTGSGSIHFTGHTFTQSGITVITQVGDNINIYIPSGSSSSVSWSNITNKPAWLSALTLEEFQTGHTHSYENLTGIPKPMQLLDTVGGVNVNNIAATAIQWTTGTTGTSLNFTGGSRIYIQRNGLYGISYVLNVNSDSSSPKNIGTIIRKNGNSDITPMSSASFNLNTANDSSTNMMPEYMVSLSNGDYIELMAFRIGDAGIVTTIGNGTWIKINKII